MNRAKNPGNVLEDPKQLSQARAWLTQLLVDHRTLAAHVDWLSAAYQTSFRPPLPRRLLDGREPRRDGPTSGFPHDAQLSEAQTSQIVAGGIAALSASEVAALLLSLYALWDLSDRISTDMPDHWLPLLNEVGTKLGQEWGIAIAIPGVPAGAVSGTT